MCRGVEDAKFCVDTPGVVTEVFGEGPVSEGFLWVVGILRGLLVGPCAGAFEMGDAEAGANVKPVFEVGAG